MAFVFFKNFGDGEDAKCQPANRKKQYRQALAVIQLVKQKVLRYDKQYNEEKKQYGLLLCHNKKRGCWAAVS